MAAPASNSTTYFLGMAHILYRDTAAETVGGNPMKLGGKVPPIVWLLVLAACGLLLIVLPTYFAGWGTHDYGVTRDFGIAVLTASILGLTIDRWLKAEIVSNVFEAAMGHVLPKEFQQEIRHVIGHNFLCEKHYMLVQIEEIGDGAVRVTESIERRIKNISSVRQQIQAYLHVDEWGFAEKSRILECQIETDEIGPLKFEREEYHPNLSVSGKTALVGVNPGQSATLVMKGIEIKRTNDDLSWVFLAPTINPVIEVRLPPSLEFESNFGTANERIDISQISNRRELQGTYFPGQRMRVHWWPKNAVKETSPTVIG
jgi:hypothetical protein